MRHWHSAVNIYSPSLRTGPRNGKSESLRSGNSSRKARGFTTAPDRECSPSASAFSSTPMPSSAPLRRSEEHTSELQSQSNLVCRLLLEKKKERRPAVYECDRCCPLHDERA